MSNNSADTSKILLKIRARVVRALPPILFVLLCFYIAKQAVWGERGVFTWQTLRNQVFTLERENAGIQQRMQQLEGEADRLMGSDPDAIDMEIRAHLPMLRKGEVLILLPRKELPRKELSRKELPREKNGQ